MRSLHAASQGERVVVLDNPTIVDVTDRTLRDPRDDGPSEVLVRIAIPADVPTIVPSAVADALHIESSAALLGASVGYWPELLPVEPNNRKRQIRKEQR